MASANRSRKGPLRYDRLGRFELADFSKLAARRVAVVGVGGLGALAAEILARAGVGELALFDYDKVEEANLNRLVYRTSQIGVPKVEALPVHPPRPETGAGEDQPPRRHGRLRVHVPPDDDGGDRVPPVPGGVQGPAEVREGRAPPPVPRPRRDPRARGLEAGPEVPDVRGSPAVSTRVAFARPAYRQMLNHANLVARDRRSEAIGWLLGYFSP